MTSLPCLNADIFSREPTALASLLHDHGVCRVEGWPGPALRDALHADLIRLRDAGELTPAGVGRSHARVTREDIRNDSTCWLDDPRCGAAAHAFLAQLDSVRVALNRTLFLGLQEFEAHYAAYPPGGGYARHRDRFRDSDARVVSWVSYLNPQWGEDDGGALRLWPETGDAVDVPPHGGSICFLSELEHEVLPANRERFSIAGWMRRRVDNPPT